MNCWIIPVAWDATHPSMIQSLRSGCVQRCSEKSISFQVLFRALELNEKIFSSHKQMLRAWMRWPAVPPLINDLHTFCFALYGNGTEIRTWCRRCHRISSRRRPSVFLRRPTTNWFCWREVNCHKPPERPILGTSRFTLPALCKAN